jgi:hypothetical protein
MKQSALPLSTRSPRTLYRTQPRRDVTTFRWYSFICLVNKSTSCSPSTTQYFEGEKRRFAGREKLGPADSDPPRFFPISRQNRRKQADFVNSVPSSQWGPYSTLWASWASGAAGFSIAQNRKSTQTGRDVMCRLVPRAN